MGEWSTGNEHDFETYVRLQLDENAKDNTRILHILEGNGQPGLIKDVDRLKETDKRRERMGWIVITIIAGILIAQVASLMLKAKS